MHRQLRYIFQGVLLGTVLLLVGMVFLREEVKDENSSTGNPSAVQAGSTEDTGVNIADPPKVLSASGLKGKKSFQRNCVFCHRLFGADTYHFSENITGTRWRDHNRLLAYLQDPGEFANNDAYTRSRQEFFGGAKMIAFPDMTLQEVDDIVEYISQVYSRNAYP